MARSPLTLAAAATAAVPDAEVVGARRLTAGGGGRFDSAVATLVDGREIVVRVANEDDVDQELAAEVVALRALTPGVREMLPFQAPEYIGATGITGGRAIVTSFVPGYLIDAVELPPGEGAATSIGHALAALHALPPSVVRSAGLRERTPEQSRAEVRRVVEAASHSGRLPVRLTVRWRDALDDDRLWAFEPSVCLGGTQAASFLFTDDERRAPRVSGVLDWHGLSIDDPAVDLRWVASAPDAARDIFRAYGEAAHRAPDAAVRVRARLHAELEFARWLVHGLEAHRSDVVDDAAALLESLAEGVKDDVLLADIDDEGRTDIDDALTVLANVPQRAEAPAVDTSMQTDAFDPDELTLGPDASWSDEKRARSTAAAHETQPIDPSEFVGIATTPDGSAHDGTDTDAIAVAKTDDAGDDQTAETRRSARAAFQRWTSSSSE
ncbi:aminoglycoside phosphotransferase [Microbacterium paludicola]|uniref:Aminoglycoside phosphotransferase n=1 Tax=Microbacterium paludicola TaxID=300019 RepID=A0A4Y9FY51_9MICO|nr:phosphotransferase [Microbacterium paludicola]MBF0815536.1 phosphotransferase [Microbacterium paludicola]TFU33801.1 aminoglycoside phosphotransferase [Microbacterium paludicola]